MGPANDYIDYVVRDGIVHEEEFIGKATKPTRKPGEGGRRHHQERGRTRNRRAENVVDVDTSNGNVRVHQPPPQVAATQSQNVNVAATDMDFSGVDVEPGFVREEQYLPKADKQQKKKAGADGSSNRGDKKQGSSRTRNVREQSAGESARERYERMQAEQARHAQAAAPPRPTAAPTTPTAAATGSNHDAPVYPSGINTNVPAGNGINMARMGSKERTGGNTAA